MTSDFKMREGFLPHLAYSAILPSFFLGSTLLYNPFDIAGYYTFGEFRFSFHLLMISCIILSCSLLTRILLFFFLERHDIKWWHYGIWCTGEVMVMSAFSALYTILFKGSDGGYFSVLADCIKFLFLTLAYPYAYLVFVRVVKIKDQELIRKDTPADNSLIRFYDEHKRLKLSIAPSSILFVSADSNYVTIHYLEGKKVKDYMLRTSMRSLENIHGRSLVRCQRSYFVNPEHITVLRKDSEGFIFAELNISGIPAVPVSKQYYEALSALL